MWGSLGVVGLLGIGLLYSRGSVGDGGSSVAGVKGVVGWGF